MELKDEYVGKRVEFENIWEHEPLELCVPQGKSYSIMQHEGPSRC